MPKLSPVANLLAEVFAECSELPEEKHGGTKKMTSMFQKLSIIYYLDVRTQAVLSFGSALGAAIVGTVFFVYAVVHSMANGGDKSTQVSLLAGSLSQFISAVNFYLYFKAARQFATFHVCLERTNRFLLANTMCESLAPPARDEVRKSLVDIVARAPMLDLDGGGEEPKPSFKAQP